MLPLTNPPPLLTRQSPSMQDSSEDVEAVVATFTSHDDTVSTKRRKHYSVKLKRQVLTALEQLSLRAASRKFGVPRRTASDCVKEKENIFSFKGSEKTMARTTGTPELIPFSTEIVTYTKDIGCTDQPLTTTQNGPLYLNRAPPLDRFLHRYPGTIRVSSSTHAAVRIPPWVLPQDEKQDDLNEAQKAFSCKYDELYGQYDPSAVFNIDETGVYYDTPPSRILCERGKSAAITTSEKHSARLTAVCSVRGDGQKLPLFFILRGAPGGCIETTELPTYPKGHLYTVPRKGWMDSRVWPKVLREVMSHFVEGPSVLQVDILDCHVSQESVDIVAGELFSTL
ncbi:Tigger transposable element-derived protein 4 [Phytophthora citrophthora]|uniref:Tigger transposable element-derived protein 4 n=1 Tax=Phytophthora citrophthora TaxID=4793 RepID=A0AAD9FZT8_9STRA|nr:Tigger transposable element-derived protein 4 [Phytophthora citrophthora]